jgi:hypothetical protein
MENLIFVQIKQPFPFSFLRFSVFKGLLLSVLPFHVRMHLSVLQEKKQKNTLEMVFSTDKRCSDFSLIGT